MDKLKQWREAALNRTKQGPPPPTRNYFFGVGPITDMSLNEMDRRVIRMEFEDWLEQTYLKYDDTGKKILGGYTAGELSRCMHRGYPADKVLLDMVRTIHRYLEFPKTVKLAVGLGGGHSGFTTAVLHLMTTEGGQRVFLDTPKPETESGKSGGFFRQSWAAQIIDMQRKSVNGDVNRICFSEVEGEIPSPEKLEELNIGLFIGVGHETTGATAYTEKEMRGLTDWIDGDPDRRMALIDGTSLFGAMTWSEDTVKRVLAKCCFFTPFQKAIGGASGYFIISLTPPALKMIEDHQGNPSWMIPRQFKLAVPENPKMTVTGRHTTNLGPIYCPEKDAMLGGVINTFSVLALAETTFGILRAQKLCGGLMELTSRSADNREAIEDWLTRHPLFAHGVPDKERRGGAVTLLKVVDNETDPSFHDRIIAKSKQLLGNEGITHPNGYYHPPLNTARYINAFPGTPGDYRAWVGGIRDREDVIAFLDNLEYAYLRAKLAVLEEELAKGGVGGVMYDPPENTDGPKRVDDPNRVYRILVCDPIGTLPSTESAESGLAGLPDCSDFRQHVESKGGVFHVGSQKKTGQLSPGIHFFYQPYLSEEKEILEETKQGEYDAVIAAATLIPEQAQFSLGGVRIGTGTGDMKSSSWGGPDGKNGEGGKAVLMNTPSFNSRGTAHSAIRALLRVRPNLDVEAMHARVIAGDFDTGRHLSDYCCAGLEGMKIGVIGFGNIGREVARIADTLGMTVTVHARSRHQKWIEAAGYRYAATIEEAASGADVLSLHIGLGAVNPATGKPGNVGVIGIKILNRMTPGSVLINYDRGEVVDTAGLGEALKSGQISHVAVDADIFVNASGEVSGPLKPYRDLEKIYPGRVSLLPHAAVDCEHYSRVTGAIQAADQIFDLIRYRRVVNLKGDLPNGYTFSGAKTVSGVGYTSVSDIMNLNEEEIKKASRTISKAAAFWRAFQAVKDKSQRQELAARYGEETILRMNRFISFLKKNGLLGPFEE